MKMMHVYYKDFREFRQAKILLKASAVLLNSDIAKYLGIFPIFA